MRSTRSCRTIRARRPDVYQALLDPAAVARWRVALGMTAVVHEFDPRENGDGTDVIMVFERVPPGVALADNEAGTAMALDQLAALVEGGGSGGEDT
jgi:hypothetical protein